MPTAVSLMFSCGHYVFLGFLCFLEKKTVVSLSLPLLPPKRKKSLHRKLTVHWPNGK
jgi:hypothetical protein